MYLNSVPIFSLFSILSKNHKFIIHIYSDCMNFKREGRVLFTVLIDASNTAYLAGQVVPAQKSAQLSSQSTLPLNAFLWHQWQAPGNPRPEKTHGRPRPRRKVSSWEKVGRGSSDMQPIIHQMDDWKPSPSFHLLYLGSRKSIRKA